MRLGTEVDTRLKSVLRGTERDARVAVRRGVTEASTGLKMAWRQQVTSAGLGQRLARTIRSRVWPRQPSTAAAGLVWSKAPTILESHNRGAVIRSPDGFFLAIPTSVVRRSGGARGRKMTPAEWERRYNRRLHFVYQKNGASMLVDRGGDPIRDRVMGRNGIHRAARRRRFREIGTVIFFLIPQARLRKRLDLDRPARQAQARLPGLIVNRWPR